MDKIELLIAELSKRHGTEGMRAIATLMHDLGSDALITFGDDTYVPCDFIMQMAWANGGAPVSDGDKHELDYVPIVGPGVDALEARKEHGEVGPEITEDELAESLRRTRALGEQTP